MRTAALLLRNTAEELVVLETGGLLRPGDETLEGERHRVPGEEEGYGQEREGPAQSATVPSHTIAVSAPCMIPKAASLAKEIAFAPTRTTASATSTSA